MNTNQIRIPSLKFFHPTKTGKNGAAVMFELHPAHGTTDGALYVRMTKQILCNDGEYPKFDYENSLYAKLGFTDVAKMLQVFRGECEKLDDGDGITLRTSADVTVVNLEHCIDPRPGYVFSVASARIDDTGNVPRAAIVFTPAEALGLAEALTGAMSLLAFGTGFEATSIAIARDEAAAELKEKTDADAKEDTAKEDTSLSEKEIVACHAVGTLCAYYGKEYAHRIEEAVNRAVYGEGATDEEYKLGIAALGSDNKVFKYVKKISG